MGGEDGMRQKKTGYIFETCLWLISLVVLLPFAADSCKCIEKHWQRQMF